MQLNSQQTRPTFNNSTQYGLFSFSYLSWKLQLCNIVAHSCIYIILLWIGSHGAFFIQETNINFRAQVID